MKLPITPEMKAISQRIIWFEDPELALSRPIRFLAYAMRYATLSDMITVRSHISNEDFKLALQNAPPGIIDPRSWTYWHLTIGQSPAPPLPVRKFE